VKFYIKKADLQRVWDGCDLGDSVGVRVYMYPHKDHVPELSVCLTEFEPEKGPPPTETVVPEKTPNQKADDAYERTLKMQKLNQTIEACGASAIDPSNPPETYLGFKVHRCERALVDKVGFLAPGERCPWCGAWIT
jgi:hypothetical protein